MPAPIGNKYALGNNGGRPPIFASAEAMQEKVIAYLEHCEENNEKLTITGLVLFLGFCDRHTFYEYEKKEEFSHVVKRAKAVIENAYEQSLHYNSPTGAIFALKNMGWKDKTETEHSGGVNLHYDGDDKNL